MSRRGCRRRTQICSAPFEHGIVCVRQLASHRCHVARTPGGCFELADMSDRSSQSGTHWRRGDTGCRSRCGSSPRLFSSTCCRCKVIQRDPVPAELHPAWTVHIYCPCTHVRLTVLASLERVHVRFGEVERRRCRWCGDTWRGRRCCRLGKISVLCTGWSYNIKTTAWTFEDRPTLGVTITCIHLL